MAQHSVFRENRSGGSKFEKKQKIHGNFVWQLSFFDEGKYQNMEKRSIFTSITWKSGI
jgi:hypothetical protein